MALRVLKLRWPTNCATCRAALPRGTRASWDPVSRTVTCLDCRAGMLSTRAPTDRPSRALSPTAAQAAQAWQATRAAQTGHPTLRPGIVRVPGRAGASAQREYERRRYNREARTRRRHPLIGGLLLAWRAAPQHELAWRQGAAGEQSVARSLQRRTRNGPAVILHDRQMPGGRGNIDHLAIAPRGVFVVDSKAIKGRVRVRHPLFGTPSLLIGGRDCTRLLDGLDRQVAAVATVLAAAYGQVAVQGALCFTKADLPLLGRHAIRGHLLLSGRPLAWRLKARGPLTQGQIEAIADALHSAFPPA